MPIRTAGSPEERTRTSGYVDTREQHCQRPLCELRSRSAMKLQRLLGPISAAAAARCLLVQQRAPSDGGAAGHEEHAAASDHPRAASACRGLDFQATPARGDPDSTRAINEIRPPTLTALASAREPNRPRELHGKSDAADGDERMRSPHWTGHVVVSCASSTTGPADA